MATTNPTIVFMGTPDFAVPALEALHRAFGVRAVVTVPDKPRGRGLELQPSAIKVEAARLGIETIVQPSSLKQPEFVSTLLELQPDIICVIAFRILPREVYSLASIGSFNVHASLLPKYRGAAPINHAIMNGDSVSGVTSFLLNDVVDTGTILHQIECPIADGTTAGELYEALKPLAAQCAVMTTTSLLNGTAVPKQQDDSLASAAPKVFRETSGINWHQPAATVRNFIHGLSPTPCAWTQWNGSVLKVYRAAHTQAPCQPGTWMIDGLELIAGCADGSLRLTEIQLPGKRRIPTADVLRGYRGPTSGSFVLK